MSRAARCCAWRRKYPKASATVMSGRTRMYRGFMRPPASSSAYASRAATSARVGSYGHPLHARCTGGEDVELETLERESLARVRDPAQRLNQQSAHRLGAPASAPAPTLASAPAERHTELFR